MISWILLFIGGLFEILFVTFMKLSQGFKVRKYAILSALSVAISLYTLSLALRELPLGVGYSVWAGIGSIGTVIVGIFLFNESRNFWKLFCILLIITGIVGLRLSTI